MQDIARKSTGFLIDELITTCIKEHYSASLPEPRPQLQHGLEERRTALNSALTERFPESPEKPLANLIAQLTSTLINCWQAQEVVMSANDLLKVAQAAKDAQRFNAQRNELIREIDGVLGESAVTVTAKTYG